MRLSNREKTPLYSFIYSVAGIIFILWIIVYILEINKFDVFGNKSWLLLIVPIMMVFSFYFSGRPIFEYDSDGEALNFRNSHILMLFSKKDAKDEFPKYKLIKFNIVNAFIYKRLYVYISSKKSNVLILKYDISYLSSKQIKDLKFSLNKVTKANRESSQENNTEKD